MPGNASKVVVTERQANVLTEFSKSRSVPQRLADRAAMVMFSFAGLTNEEISQRVGVNRMQVGLWRRRWRDNWDSLTVLECREPLKLREAIREVFRDAPRRGCQPRVTADQVNRIQAVACESPRLSGRPISHWSVRELRDEVIHRQIVVGISEAQVGRYLRQAALQPHRRKMWINTTEKDPVAFRRQAGEVCQTYLDAPQKKREGIHTVSLDEMTGLQALERAAPDQGMAPGRIARQEFEYIRHGTTTLIGNLDVATGRLFAPTLGPTRTEPDFVNHIARMVATDPQAPWIFVLDNLNIHWSASLVEWVARQCGVDDNLGVKGHAGILKSQVSRREFLSLPDHRIRFVYTPKHSSWLNQIEIVFGIINRKMMRRGNFVSVAELEAQLRMFIEYYNATMAHPFAWTYTGKPLVATRAIRFCPLHRHPNSGNVTPGNIILP
jgi:transposase